MSFNDLPQSAASRRSRRRAKVIASWPVRGRALAFASAALCLGAANEAVSVAQAQEPVGVFIVPADAASGQPVLDPAGMIAAEVQQQATETPAKDDAPTDKEGESKKEDAPTEGQDKFNPQLIQNNPKAHAYSDQLRGAVLVELGVLKRAIDLAPEELTKCTEIAQDDLFQVASEYAVRSGKISGSRYYPPPYNPETSEDIVGPLVTSVRAAIAESLPEEKRAKYVAALEQQAQFRRDACLESLLSRLEICLVLSEEQRQQIAAVLDKNWDPKWEQSGAMQGISHESFPNVPAKLLAPYLDEDQMASWSARHKDLYYGFVVGSGVVSADIPWDAERHR